MKQINLDYQFLINQTSIKVLSNQSMIRQWNTDGFPGDEFSIENAILLRK